MAMRLCAKSTSLQSRARSRPLSANLSNRAEAEANASDSKSPSPTKRSSSLPSVPYTFTPFIPSLIQSKLAMKKEKRRIQEKMRRQRKILHYQQVLQERYLNGSTNGLIP